MAFALLNRNNWLYGSAKTRIVVFIMSICTDDSIWFTRLSNKERFISSDFFTFSILGTATDCPIAHEIGSLYVNLKWKHAIAKCSCSIAFNSSRKRIRGIYFSNRSEGPWSTCWNALFVPVIALPYSMFRKLLFCLFDFVPPGKSDCSNLYYFQVVQSFARVLFCW